MRISKVATTIESVNFHLLFPLSPILIFVQQKYVKMTADAAAKPAPKPKKAPVHPPAATMVVAAVKELKERKGSSAAAIKKYIHAHYKVDDKINIHIKKAFTKCVEQKKLIQVKGKGASGSFKLAPEEKQPKKKVVKKEKAKKATTPKKPKAKKTKSPKKAAAVKPKKATTPKKKAAVKKPAAAKKTPAKKPATKKPAAAKKATPKKPAAKKPAAKKPAAKKTAAKK